MTFDPQPAGAAPAPGWRHPNLLSVTVPDQFGRCTATIKPFTGREPQPEIPPEWNNPNGDGGWDAHGARHQEIDMVRPAWAKARHELLFSALYSPGTGAQDLLTAHLRKQGDEWARHPVGYSGTAGDVWRAYAEARDELVAAYEAMRTQSDNKWRAGLGRIVDAAEPARRAARNWDNVAEAFLRLARWYAGHLDSHDRPALPDIVERTGRDLKLAVDGWVLAYGLDDYRTCSDYGDTAHAEIAKVVREGERRLAEIDSRYRR